MKSSLFSRYTCFVLSILLTLVFLIMMRNHPWFWLPALACGGLMVLGIYDLTQQRHAICRNYPIIGRLRFFFEFIRPELRQYFLEQDNEEIPFSRTQRTLVYRRAKTRSATSRSAPCWMSTKPAMSASATPCGRWKPPTRPVSASPSAAPTAASPTPRRSLTFRL